MSRFKNFTLIVAAIICSIIFWITINGSSNKMDKIIKEKHLRYTGAVTGANSLVSFTTVALGSFRGVVADLLWLRANKLQDKGDYYEMVQLAQWITDLQPEFSGAAAFLAWNMAYNISVTCSFYDDRWRWVNEGIKLLRDRAIIYNPEDPTLYKELGWIFQHKMGNILDDAQQYYKNQLANDMMLVVTNEPDWEGIAAAPKNHEDFVEKYENSKIANALFATNYADNLTQLDADFRKNSEVPQSLVTALNNDETLVQELDNFLRAQYLRDKYKLDPEVILEINNQYGKLDWRLPEAQAIYWATMGLKKTPGNRSVDCERMISQGLFEAFKSGKMLILDNKDFKNVMLMPNFDVIDSVRKFFDDTIELNPNILSFKSAREGFMKDAIMLLYNYGKFEKAEEYFKLLKKDRPELNFVTLEQFAMRELFEEIKDPSYKKMMDLIDGRLERSFTYVVYGDDDAAIANEKIARALYIKHQKEFADVPRLVLPPYSKIKNEVLNKILASTSKEVGDLLKSRLSIKPDIKDEDIKDIKDINDLDAINKK